YTDAGGLIYLLNRYYQASTGQFISVDPDIAQTLQPYVYAGGDPVSNVDPTGNSWVWYGGDEYGFQWGPEALHWITDAFWAIAGFVGIMTVFCGYALLLCAAIAIGAAILANELDYFPADDNYVSLVFDAWT